MTFLICASKLFIALMGAHALCDYALQPEWMAKKKSPERESGFNEKCGPWWWIMGAHSAINGLGVGWVTHSYLFGILETLLHFATDTNKCLGTLSTEADQFIHVTSKLAWAACVAATIS